MAQKSFSSLGELGGMVYSTDPDADFSPVQKEEAPALPPEKQRLTLRRDTSGRKGKVVTLVEGFQGPEAALEELAKNLKRHCGTGGSAKDGQVVIQGDVRAKADAFLKAGGYKTRVL